MRVPSFSIITICFNAGEALRRTIESVNEQSYQQIEHIIIDGGSKDSSVALIQSLARRDVHWISEPDAGIADAFNKGTALAKNDYICYLNAGDVFATSDVLQRAANAISLSDGQPAVYFGDYIAIRDDIPSLRQTSAAEVDFAWTNPLNHQSTLIPRPLALRHPYDLRLKLGMDYDFWLRVLKEACFVKLGFPVAVFALDGRSSNPAWAVHNLIVRRVLWHINRGTRLGLSDIFQLGLRAAALKLRFLLKSLAGAKAVRLIRRTKSGHTPAIQPAPALKLSK